LCASMLGPTMVVSCTRSPPISFTMSPSMENVATTGNGSRVSARAGMAASPNDKPPQPKSRRRVALGCQARFLSDFIIVFLGHHVPGYAKAASYVRAPYVPPATTPLEDQRSLIENTRSRRIE